MCVCERELGVRGLLVSVYAKAFRHFGACLCRVLRMEQFAERAR